MDRRSIAVGFLLCLVLVLAPLALSAADATTPVAGNDDGACAQGATTLLLAGSAPLVALVPAPTPQIFCPQAFCSQSIDCRNICPQASSVACVNSVCQYDYSGGGGGGGPICPQAFCSNDLQCRQICPDGPNSYCSGLGTCVYQ